MASKKSSKTESTKTGTAKVKSNPENVTDSGITTLNSGVQTLAYSQKTWVNGELILADDLNNMERGIADNSNAADNAQTAAESAQSTAESAQTAADKAQSTADEVLQYVTDFVLGGSS